MHRLCNNIRKIVYMVGVLYVKGGFFKSVRCPWLDRAIQQKG